MKRSPRPRWSGRHPRRFQHRLQCLLPQGREAVLEPILGTIQPLGLKGLIAWIGTAETAASLLWPRKKNSQTHPYNLSELDQISGREALEFIVTD